MTDRIPALLFVWRHGVLGVDSYATLEEAVNVAVSIEDHGNGSAHGVFSDGEWIDANDPRWRTIERQYDARQDEQLRRQPPLTHVLKVQAPDGEWADAGGFETLNDAIAEARSLPLPTRITEIATRKLSWKSDFKFGG